MGKRRLVALLAVVLMWPAIATRHADPVAAAEPDNAATRDYAVALGFQRKGLFPQAAERWTKFLATHPQDERVPSAHYYQGVCYFQQQDLAKAAEKFRHVLGSYKDFPHRDAAQFNLGLALYNAAAKSAKPEDYKQAAAAFAEVPKQFPQSTHAAQAGYFQGESLYQAGDAKAAVTAYQQTLAKHPDDALAPDLLLAAGVTQQEQGEHADAEQTFRQFLAKHGEHKSANEAKLRLGLAEMQSGKTAEAERRFREASTAKDFPLADYAMLHHGQALFALNKLNEAAGVFEQLTVRFKESPHVAAALLSAGKVRWQEKKYSQARAALERLLREMKDAPEAAEATYWLAQALRGEKKSADALKLLDAGLAQYATSEFRPKLAFARVECIADDEARKKDAVAGYAQFAGQYPQHEHAAEAVYRAARLALELGDYPEARKHADAFLSRAEWKTHALRPDVLYVDGEATLLADPPDFARAEQHYRELVTAFPEHPRRPAAAVRAGHCLVAAKQYDPAVAWLTQSLGALKDNKPLVAEAHFLIGRAHADAGRAPQAVAAYRESRKADAKWPRGDEALLALASAIESLPQKDPAAAKAALDELVREYKESPLRDRAMYRLGGLAMDAQKWDEAASWYRRVAADFKDSPLAAASQYGAGAALFRKGDDAAAIAELSNLITRWPQAEEAKSGRFLRGMGYYRAKKHAEAAADLKAFLESKPPDMDQTAQAQFTLALCQVALEQHPAAVETLKQYLAANPEGEQADEARYELAFAHLRQSQSGPAAEAFTELVGRHPDSPLAAEAWFRLGEIREKESKPAEAVKAFEAGLAKAKDPTIRGTLLYQLGRLNHDQGEHAKAAGHLLTLLKEFPKGKLTDDATHLAAECLYRQEKFAEALPLFEQSAKSSNEAHQARSLYRAGHCATRLGKWADAERHYQEVVTRFGDPKQFAQAVEARYGLAFAQQNQREFDEARKQHAEVIAATDTETAAKSRFMLGEIDFAEKKYDSALEHYLEAALGYPYDEWRAQGHYQAGRCLIQLGQPEKARTELEFVIQKYAQHRLAKDAAQLLTTLSKATASTK
jgi:TolA-binding protein